MLPFIALHNAALCMGCGACAQACPRACITMRRDAEGFAYPCIDAAKCTDCGRCADVCPIGRDWRELHATAAEPIFYAAWHLDEAVRQASSSGGVFSALALPVLRDGGTVFGAAFSTTMELAHVAVQDEELLAQVRGSKYLQSSTRMTYAETRSILNQGRTVLYTGTPCQIGGLYAFLGGNPEGLTTVDLICHGVPSANVFTRYLHSLETTHVAPVTSVRFRDKRYGWRRFSLSVATEKGIVASNTLDRDPYLIAFLRNLCLRPSCGICPYARPQRIADITLGDFWGIGRSAPDLDDDKGISEVLVSSERGQRLFEASRDALFVQPLKLENGIQQNMQRPSVHSSLREAFFADLDNMTWAEIEKKYLQPDRRLRVRSLAGRAKRHILRLLARKAAQ